MFRSLISPSTRLILRSPRDVGQVKHFSGLRTAIIPVSQRVVISGVTRSLHNAPFLHSYKGSKSPSCPEPVEWKKLTNEEWASRLSPEAYFCTREDGTEPPFSGQYVNHKAEGVYKCVCCGSDLYGSKAKYDSGSGWPSFYAPVNENAIIRRKDVSHGMVRIEILCTTCNAHLGHVFDDGPQPTGERHCVNSVSLKFSPRKLVT